MDQRIDPTSRFGQITLQITSFTSIDCNSAFNLSWKPTFCGGHTAGTASSFRCKEHIPGSRPMPSNRSLYVERTAVFFFLFAAGMTNRMGQLNETKVKRRFKAQ